MKTKGPECFAPFQSSEGAKTDDWYINSDFSSQTPMAILRLQTKVFKYTCFYFPEARQVGTAPTANACEGHRKK